MDLSSENLYTNTKIKDDTIKIPLPGVGKDNIKVEFDTGSRLKVTYKYKKDTKDNLEFRTPGYIDAESEYKDGVLKIKLIKDKESTKLIEVK